MSPGNSDSVSPFVTALWKHLRCRCTSGAFAARVISVSRSLSHVARYWRPGSSTSSFTALTASGGRRCAARRSRPQPTAAGRRLTNGLRSRSAFAAALTSTSTITRVNGRQAAAGLSIRSLRAEVAAKPAAAAALRSSSKTWRLFFQAVAETRSRSTVHPISIPDGRPGAIPSWRSAEMARIGGVCNQYFRSLFKGLTPDATAVYHVGGLDHGTHHTKALQLAVSTAVTAGYA